MPPNRRRKIKKSGRIDTKPVITDDDDDVFETEVKPVKNTFKRYKASKATRENLRSNSKLSVDEKHVAMKRKKSPSPRKKINDDLVIVSEESDIEFDIEPSQKHQTRSADGEAGESTSKRQNICGNSPDNQEFEGTKNAPIVTEPIVEKDSNTTLPEENVLNSRQTLDHDSDELDFELALENDIDTQMELDAKEANDAPTKNTTVTTEMAAPENENESDAGNEHENEAQDENENENATEADFDMAAIESEFDAGCADDQEIADDYLNLFADDDELFDDIDDPMKSPVVRAKKVDSMKIPKWKEAQIEKDKNTDPKKVEVRRIDMNKSNETDVVKRIFSATVPSTNTTAKVSATAETTTTASASATAAALPLLVPPPQKSLPKLLPDKSKSVFKIPVQVQQPSNRDPRLAKIVLNSSNAPNVPSNENQSHSCQPTPLSNQNAPLTNANVAERLSVKARLGTRLLPQGLFSNLKNTTSFVIPNNLQLTAAESSSIASRVNQPIPSIPIPKSSSENVHQQTLMQPPSIRPTPPAFAQTSRRQNDMQLIIPSFASGAQKYEPVFTHLFRTTCRYFMRDACLKPDCPLEHRLPDHVFFRKEIDKMFQASIIDLYENYMCRNQKLFDFYFNDFCQYFGKNMLVDNLKKMVEDCSYRKVPFHFTSIIEGLMLTGRSFTKALAVLIPAIQYRTVKTSREIIKLILNPRIENIEPFVKVIDSIRQQEHFKFSNEWINRLLVIHSQKITVNVEFNNTIFNLISGLDKKSATALDQDLFTKFIEAFAQQGLNAS